MAPLALATGGLFYAWLANDIEEYLTMPGLRHPMLTRVNLGTEPDGALSRDQVDPALTAMGALFAAAAIDGYRTGGRSPFYQAALYGYGMHGFIHLGSALALRGYTSGVATAPVVLGFWAFANRTLRAHGVEPRPHRWTIGAFAPVGLATHLAAKAVVQHCASRRQLVGA